MKNVKDNDDYTFVMYNKIHSKSVCKWIMDSRAFKHMTLYRVVFDTYEPITSCNVYLSDSNIVQAIGMESIVMETILKGKINQFCMKDVICIPKLHTKLLLLSILMSTDLKAHST